MAKKSRNDRKVELAQFLKTRRAKVKPPALSFAGANRRRTPGLRREEVAEMAGVSLSWYTWLEQARDVNPSAPLLMRLSSILKLSPSETKHLFVLAERPLPAITHPPQPIPASLENLVKKTLRVPAYVYDERLEFVIWNQEFKKRFFDIGAFPENQRSLLDFIFRDENVNQNDPKWQANARRAVAEFRMSVGKNIDSPRVKELVTRLQGSSPSFAKLWKTYEVQERDDPTIEYTHPDYGAVKYERSIYIPVDAEDFRLVVLTPTPKVLP